MKNTREKLLLSVVAAGLIAFTGSAQAEVAVIANPSSPITSASNNEIKRLFLGKAKNVAGNSATPVDQSGNSPAKEQFYQVVVGKNSSQLRAYWAKLVFTGKGKPPKGLGTDADVVAAVAADASLIGYVDASAVGGNVKVILLVQ